MKLEHLALQVADPAAMAEWYARHLGCSIARSAGPPVPVRFVLDSPGTVMLELYRNPRVPVPDYGSMDPVLLHIAFVSADPAADRDRLVKAGARVIEDLNTNPARDQFVMLRDPWGLPLQLVQRAAPMVKA